MTEAAGATQWITAVLLVIGASFMLLGAIGILRMPDLFMRLQTATKAVTFGVGFAYVAVAMHFFDFSITIRALLIIAFFFLTAPVAAHRIARASYFVGVRLWEKTLVDELRGHYDPKTHALADGSAPPPPGDTRKNNT